MQKIVYILLIGIFCTGCSVSRKRNSNSEAKNLPAASDNIIKSVVDQNITNKCFFIEKAEFKIISGVGEKTGIGTIKFILPDKFLVSIKSNAGIEIARIYITEDSLMVNDRFNKKLYYGSASALKKKYGLNASMLPVILGDYVNDEKIDENKVDCSGGKLNIEALIKDINLRYNIDCKYGKNILTEPANYVNASGIKIEYGSFFTSDGINIPGTIVISEKQNNTRIEIRILKIVIPWEGSIEFIPGRQYEKIHLL